VKTLTTLKDVYPQGRTIVWYMNDRYFGMGIRGYEWLKERVYLPDISRLKETHILVGLLEEQSKEKVFTMMQGESYSPNGEARGLIRKLGLGHTSMSVGDIIQNDEGFWMIDRAGFKLL
jgi:hypothetical protein